MLRISQDFGFPNAIVREWQVPIGIEQTKGESAGGPQTIMPGTLFADPIVGKTSACRISIYHKILVYLCVKHFSDLIIVVHLKT